MIIPIIGNPAAQALALMVQKGGTLRLRAAELAPMNNFALLVEASPSNPEVMHIKTVTRDEVRRIMLDQQKVEAAMTELARISQEMEKIEEKAETEPQG